MQDLFSGIEIAERREEFEKRLVNTDKEGVGSLIEYLRKTDFFTAPASSIHHSNCDGGLTYHSLNVANQAKIINEATQLNLDPKSVELVCLVHDVCKANYYLKQECWRKNAENRWESYDGWKVDEKLPLGHGEKSLVIVNKFVTLTADEMAAIRWHMGAYDPGTAFNYPSGNPFHQSMNNYPLCTLIQLADLVASQVKEKVYEL